MGNMWVHSPYQDQDYMERSLLIHVNMSRFIKPSEMNMELDKVLPYTF